MNTAGLSFGVLGPGGVGGLVAAALHRAGTAVMVVAREETAGLIAERGIDVRSVLLGDFVERVPAVSILEEPVDVLVIGTKATGLDDALDRISERAESGVVVPLLNGIEHLDRLRERFGPRVAAATIRVEADRPEPGVVVQKSPFLRIELASDGDIPAEQLGRIAEAIGATGIAAAVGESEAQVMWSKLTRLCPLAVMTSAYDLPLGAIRDDPALRSELEACIGEAAAAANADGARLDPSATLGELERAHASLGSSMQRDIAAGRSPELDQIAGAVVRRGRAHGLPCPTIESLMGRILERLP